MPAAPLNVFISYSHNAKDRPLLDELLKHLSPLQQQEAPLVKTWDDSDLLPGDEWDDEIKENLRSADIVLLLVSADFNASQYIQETELKEAIARHERGECRVAPILLRPCDFAGMPYEALEMLPKIPGTQRLEAVNGSTWKDTDHAFTQVVGRLRELIEDIRREKTEPPGLRPAMVAEQKEADTPWHVFFKTHSPQKQLRLSDTVNCNRMDHYSALLQKHFEANCNQPGNLFYLLSACDTQNPTSLAKRLTYWFDEELSVFFRPEEDKVKDELTFYNLPLEKKPQQTFGKFWELMQNKILHTQVSFEDFAQTPADYLPLPDQARALLAFQISESDLLEYRANQHVRYIVEQFEQLPPEHQKFVLFFVFHLPDVHATRRAECEYLIDLLDTMAEDTGGLHLSCLPPVPEGDLKVWWNGRFEHVRFAEFLQAIQSTVLPDKRDAYIQQSLYDMHTVEAMQYAAYVFQRDRF